MKKFETELINFLQVLSVFAFETKSMLTEAFYLLKFKFSKIYRAGAGKKISGAGAEEKWFGSATLLGTFP